MPLALSASIVLDNSSQSRRIDSSMVLMSLTRFCFVVRVVFFFDFCAVFVFLATVSSRQIYRQVASLALSLHKVSSAPNRLCQPNATTRLLTETLPDCLCVFVYRLVGNANEDRNSDDQ